MKLGNQAFVPTNPRQAGQEMHVQLIAVNSPVPKTYIHVREAAGGGRVIAVPATKAGDFQNLPPEGLVPRHQQAFTKARAAFNAEADRKSILIHQRGYGITESTSDTPWLSTTQIAPCIACMIYSPATKIGALLHVDANQNDASIAAVVDEFPPAGDIDVFFHGGLTGNADSLKTCQGLLQALFDAERRRKGALTITVREFDVMDRPHGKEVTFDTGNGSVHPSLSTSNVRLDSEFRTLSDGTYMAGDGVRMANLSEAMHPSPAAVSARDIRKQFDGRSSRYRAFSDRVLKAACAATAVAAVERAGKGDVAAVTRILEALPELVLVERNLQSYLAATGVAGDKNYLVEVIVGAILHGSDVKARASEWLQAQRL